MKKLICAVTIIMFAGITTLAAQGINFEKASWKEVLSKAKEQNKLIFIDVYTSWCGPCKMMAANVFPLKQVGDKFNSSFLNFGIDAEKGEGVEIAKTYNVHAFPTYLFVNGDGQLMYRAVGGQSVDQFLKLADLALMYQNDLTPFAKLEEEYNAGNRNKQFLLSYLKKRASLQVPSADIIEVIFPMLTEKDLADSALVSYMLSFSPSIEYVPNGKFYNYIVQHHSQLDSAFHLQSLPTLNSGIRNYFLKNIIVNHKEEMLPVTLAAAGRLMSLMGDDAEKDAYIRMLTMNYYSKTHDEQKTMVAASDFVNNSLLKMDMAAMQREDAVDLKQMREPFISGERDSTKDQFWAVSNKVVGKRRQMQFAFSLEAAAQAVYHNTKNAQMLDKALAWAKQAFDVYPSFATEAVYGALLTKTGKKKEGIEMMEKAAADPTLIGNKNLLDLMQSNLAKIKEGIEPEHLVHPTD
jgi:thiol-disulfide isomerase/thioredoxin